MISNIFSFLNYFSIIAQKVTDGFLLKLSIGQGKYRSTFFLCESVLIIILSKKLY